MNRPKTTYVIWQYNSLQLRPGPGFNDLKQVKEMDYQNDAKSFIRKEKKKSSNGHYLIIEKTQRNDGDPRIKETGTVYAKLIDCCENI